jgi:hypothetical protein
LVSQVDYGRENNVLRLETQSNPEANFATENSGGLNPKIIGATMVDFFCPRSIASSNTNFTETASKCRNLKSLTSRAPSGN